MDYSHMTVAELRKIAKEKGVPKATSLKKQELLDALAALEAEAEKKENENIEDTAAVSVVEDAPVLERIPAGETNETDGENSEANGEEGEKSAEGENQEKSADGQQQGDVLLGVFHLSFLFYLM